MRSVLLQLFVFIIFLGISTVSRAEYFLVYAAGSGPCNSCAERVVYQPCCSHRPVRHHCYHKQHDRHYVRYHRPCNGYRIEVYRYEYVMPCCSDGCRYRCQPPADDFVTFSGQPAGYYTYYEGTTDSNYYQDQRTADDTYSDMNINN